VIRNAGGRATDDAIRSLVISHKLLGTREWFVIHHTNCGMELFTDGVMGDLLDDNLETANFDGKLWSNPTHGNGASAGRFIKWHTITDQPSSVTDDVRHSRASARFRQNSDLRLRLRCSLRQSRRGKGGDRGWPLPVSSA
jgi:carbonic anhydrase